MEVFLSWLWRVGWVGDRDNSEEEAGEEGLGGDIG